MAQNLIAEIAKGFITNNTDDVTDIVTFSEAPWGLNVKLLPTQRFILRCLYGLPLDDVNKSISVPDVINENILYTFTEKDFLKWLYAEGRCNTDVTEGKVFHELVLSIGRRGGKSSMASFISNYELYRLLKRGDPAKYYNFQPNMPVYILNVAPTDDQAGIVFDMIQGTAMQCPFMKDRVLHNTMTYFDLQSDADIKLPGKPRAGLISMAGGCSSNSLRGRNAVVVIMDEMAHFIDNSGRFSGSEVYKALTPSIASFGRDGKIITISSPYAKYGAFYDRYNQSFEEKDITLTFRMYSAMVNPTIPTEILAAARRRDRIGFMCEYGGEFSDAVTAWIDDENEFRRKAITTSPQPTKGLPDIEYYMGIDLGFKNDGTGVSIVHKDRKTNQIILDYTNVWFSGSSDVWETENSIYRSCDKYRGNELLEMMDIVNEVKELTRWFPIKKGIFDQHNGYGLAELFRREKLKQFEMEQFTDQLNSDVYQLMKMLYSEHLIQVFNHSVLISELVTLEAEKRAKSKVLVRAPKRKGAHDDISDSFARAIWLCYNNQSDRAPNIATGAGGGVGSYNSAESSGARIETMASFNLKRLKMHGAHPRLSGGLGRGNNMTSMGRRLTTGI